jgi:hypothetical protein
MQSRPATVVDYLASLPADRRAAVETVRQVIRDNLPPDYVEGMSYGMIGYAVPHRVYPPGYHADPRQPLPFAALASQKGHLALYLMAAYCGADGPEPTEYAAWLRDAWARSGKKLDMGKSCIRFKRVDDLPLEVVAEAVRRVPAKTYIEWYEAGVGTSRAGAKAGAKRAAGPAKVAKAVEAAGLATAGKAARPAKAAGPARGAAEPPATGGRVRGRGAAPRAAAGRGRGVSGT